MDTGRIQVLSGKHRGKSFDVRMVLLIGRGSWNEISLDDAEVSRRHAAVVFKGPETYIMDMGSVNGTYVGNRRVFEQNLRNEDVIRVGAIELQYLENAS